MKLAYVVNTRIPTDKAHGYQIMRVCSELSKLGHEVKLYVPDRSNPITDDPFAYYGVEKNFIVQKITCFDAMRFVKVLGPLAFWLTMRSFLRALNVPKDFLIYTRDADAVEFFKERPTIYNAHNWDANRRSRVQHARGIVCNSKGTEAAVKESLNLPTVVAPNATDPNAYIGKKEVELPYPTALYAGQMYGWKGSNTLLEAAKLLPEIQFVVIGGTGEGPKNMHFLGLKPKQEVPKYLAAADVLLLPNSKEGESKFTSPLKMFEYMASGTPIVASDLPAIREVLSDDTAILVEPDNAQALADGIKKALSDPSRAQKALVESQKYSWSAHAQKVAEFIASVCTPTTE